MTQHNPLFSDRIAHWTDDAQRHFWACRALFLSAAERAAVTPLDESLKWGQPAWRPRKPRTGSTLRMGWNPDTPDHLSVFVDCKTDLAERMRSLYPDAGLNDGRRQIRLALAQPLPEQALSDLAEMTFTYHLSAARKAAIG